MGPNVSLRGLYGIPMGLYEISVGSPWDLYGSPWGPYGHPMCVPVFPVGPRVWLWALGHPPGSLRGIMVLCGLPMDVCWFPVGSLWVSMGALWAPLHTRVSLWIPVHCYRTP